MKSRAVSRPLPLHRPIASLMAVIGFSLCASWLEAASYTWDADASAGTQDGSGNWDAASTNWITGGSNVVWADANSAIFGAGTDGNYTVDVAIDPSATSLI